MQAFQRTIDALAKSHNDAAAPVLIAAIEAGDPQVFDGVVAALVARRSKAGHFAVLSRWHLLSATQRQLVLKRRGWMAAALRDALLSEDDQIFSNGRDIADASGEFDVVPTLIMVAEQPDELRWQTATALAMRLVDKLSTLIVAAKEQRDSLGLQELETTRLCVLESLERSVERFRQHQRAELIEAFVVLAGPYSGTLKSIMDAPHHPCFQSVVHVLQNSQAPAVLQLLIAILQCKDASQVVRNVVSKRTDVPFVDALLAMPIDPSNTFLRKNLGRIRGYACLEAGQPVCMQLSDQQQASAMQLLAATGAADNVKLDLAATLLAQGSTAGRLAACVALQAISGQRSNDLVLDALKDSDAEVQAAAVRQLRDRHIPGTLATLMQLIYSPLEPVSRAAREALSEFSFDSYLAQFDALDEDERRTTGGRVARIDATSLTRLREELASPGRRQRLRAIEMADAMGLTQQAADALVERLSDEDHLVRAAAADALQHCKPADVRSALQAAVSDHSAAVQNAARNSLRALGLEIVASGATPQETAR